MVPLSHSADRAIRAKLRDVSTNIGPDRAPLYTYAIACELLDEIDAKGLKVAKVQELSGIKARSWSDYFGGKTRGVPLEKWAAICTALGLKTSVVLERAERRIEQLRDSEAQLMLNLSGPAAMMVMRERSQGGGGDVRGGEVHGDPPGVTTKGRRSA
jgi:hypothetical protein